MTATRSTDYLKVLGPVTIVGTGSAAETAAEILTILGAAVDRHPDLTATAGAVRGLDRSPIVICDLVASGVPAGYVAEVAGRGSGTWVTISAFGLDGPLAGQPGSDLIGAAAGGLLSTVRDSDNRFFPMPGAQALKVAGHMAALATVHGVSMLSDGRSVVHLDLSVQEAVAFCSIQQEVAHQLYDCRGPAGAARYATPSGVFSCADGEIGMTVLDNHQWVRACEVFDKPSWPQEFPSPQDRLANRPIIQTFVAEWTSTRSKYACESALQTGGVAAVALRTLPEVQHLEQFRARDFLKDGDGATLSTEALPASVTHSERPHAEPRRAKGLRGLRVVEATGVLAGPLAGAILGAVGAEVVRLEAPDRLDIYRRNGPFKLAQPGVERAAYFLMSNYCKRSVSRGIGTDRALMEQICGWADVLLENLGPRRLGQLGIESDRMFADAGKSTVSISGFGRYGPCSDYKAYAPNVHAFAGLAKAVHEFSDEHATVMTSFADYCVAVWGALLAAAWWLGDGDGCTFDLSMAEVIAAKLNGIALHAPEGVQEIAKEFLVRTADGGQIAVAFGHESDYRTVAGILGLDPADTVVTPAADVIILDATASAQSPSGAEILRAATASDAVLMAYLAQPPIDLFADPQIQARGFLVELDHPEVETSPVLALPWKNTLEPRTGYRRAPLLGEDDAWMATVVKGDAQ
jgi:crotonobetainyl-CoA:carnitine CoA-transferase CaiB-like acyl-CoA transferase